MTVEEWLMLIRSSDASDRIQASDELPTVDSPEIPKALLVALSDEHALVRTCAADSLGDFPSTETRQGLRDRVAVENDELAMAHLLSSLGAMGSVDDLGVLSGYMQTSTNPIVRLHAAYGVLLACVEPILDMIIEESETVDQTHRTKALNTLRVAIELLDNVASDARTAAERQYHSRSADTDSASARAQLDRILKRT